MDEFQLIAEIFAPLAPPDAPAFGLRDDAAILEPPAGQALVFTKDIMAAGVHFPADEDAGLVGRKLLRVNLSDLAAMGAEPLAYLLGLAAGPDTGVDWFRAFADGLAEDQEEFGVALWGGDTIAHAGGAVLSLTAIGTVPLGEKALARSGARPGDLLFVSGTIGDGALGLKCVQGALAADEALMARYRLPQPRIALGAGLRGLATSCIDVSDGLLADLAHLAEASHCGATIERDAIPLSGPARAALADDPALWPVVLGGGDDYELLFTAPAEKRQAVNAMAAAGVRVAEIGRMRRGAAVLLLDARGEPLEVDAPGFRHHIG